MATAQLDISLSDEARAAIAALEPSDADVTLAAADAAIEVADELRAASAERRRLYHRSGALTGAASAATASIWFGLNRARAEDLPSTVETPRGISVRGQLIPRSFRAAKLAGGFFQRVETARLPIRRLTVDIDDELRPQVEETGAEGARHVFRIVHPPSGGETWQLTFALTRNC